MYLRSPVSILPAARAQNMNASSESGLWARCMVGMYRVDEGERLPGGRGTRARCRRSDGGSRFGVEGVDGGAVLGVFGTLARALRALVREECLVGLPRPRGVPFFRESLCPQHQAIQMCRSRREDRVGFRQRA